MVVGMKKAFFCVLYRTFFSSMRTTLVLFISVYTSTTTQGQVTQVDVLTISLVAAHLRLVIEASTVAALPTPAAVRFPSVCNGTAVADEARNQSNNESVWPHHSPVRIVYAVAHCHVPHHPDQKNDAVNQHAKAELGEHFACNHAMLMSEAVS